MQYAFISKYALISDMRLITQKYGIILNYRWLRQKYIHINFYVCIYIYIQWTYYMKQSAH